MSKKRRLNISGRSEPGGAAPAAAAAAPPPIRAQDRRALAAAAAAAIAAQQSSQQAVQAAAQAAARLVEAQTAQQAAQAAIVRAAAAAARAPAAPAAAEADAAARAAAASVAQRLAEAVTQNGRAQAAAAEAAQEVAAARAAAGAGAAGAAAAQVAAQGAAARAAAQAGIAEAARAAAQTAAQTAAQAAAQAVAQADAAEAEAAAAEAAALAAAQAAARASLERATAAAQRANQAADAAAAVAQGPGAGAATRAQAAAADARAAAGAAAKAVATVAARAAEAEAAVRVADAVKAAEKAASAAARAEAAALAAVRATAQSAALAAQQASRQATDAAKAVAGAVGVGAAAEAAQAAATRAAQAEQAAQAAAEAAAEAARVEGAAAQAAAGTAVGAAQTAQAAARAAVEAAQVAAERAEAERAAAQRQRNEAAAAAVQRQRNEAAAAAAAQRQRNEAAVAAQRRLAAAAPSPPPQLPPFSSAALSSRGAMVEEAAAPSSGAAAASSPPPPPSLAAAPPPPSSRVMAEDAVVASKPLELLNPELILSYRPQLPLLLKAEEEENANAKEGTDGASSNEGEADYLQKLPQPFPAKKFSIVNAPEPSGRVIKKEDFKIVDGVVYLRIPRVRLDESEGTSSLAHIFYDSEPGKKPGLSEVFTHTLHGLKYPIKFSFRMDSAPEKENADKFGLVSTFYLYDRESSNQQESAKQFQFTINPEFLEKYPGVFENTQAKPGGYITAGELYKLLTDGGKGNILKKFRLAGSNYLKTHRGLPSLAIIAFNLGLTLPGLSSSSSSSTPNTSFANLSTINQLQQCLSELSGDQAVKTVMESLTRLTSAQDELSENPLRLLPNVSPTGDLLSSDTLSLHSEFLLLEYARSGLKATQLPPFAGVPHAFLAAKFPLFKAYPAGKEDWIKIPKDTHVFIKGENGINIQITSDKITPILAPYLLRNKEGCIIFVTDDINDKTPHYFPQIRDDPSRLCLIFFTALGKGDWAHDDWLASIREGNLEEFIKRWKAHHKWINEDTTRKPFLGNKTWLDVVNEMFADITTLLESPIIKGDSHQSAIHSIMEHHGKCLCNYLEAWERYRLQGLQDNLHPLICYVDITPDTASDSVDFSNLGNVVNPQWFPGKELILIRGTAPEDLSRAERLALEAQARSDAATAANPNPPPAIFTSSASGGYICEILRAAATVGKKVSVTVSSPFVYGKAIEHISANIESEEELERLFIYCKERNLLSVFWEAVTMDRDSIKRVLDIGFRHGVTPMLTMASEPDAANVLAEGKVTENVFFIMAEYLAEAAESRLQIARGPPIKEALLPHQITTTLPRTLVSPQRSSPSFVTCSDSDRASLIATLQPGYFTNIKDVSIIQCGIAVGPHLFFNGMSTDPTNPGPVLIGAVFEKDPADGIFKWRAKIKFYTKQPGFNPISLGWVCEVAGIPIDPGRGNAGEGPDDNIWVWDQEKTTFIQMTKSKLKERVKLDRVLQEIIELMKSILDPNQKKSTDPLKLTGPITIGLTFDESMNKSCVSMGDHMWFNQKGSRNKPEKLIMMSQWNLDKLKENIDSLREIAFNLLYDRILIEYRRRSEEFKYFFEHIFHYSNVAVLCLPALSAALAINLFTSDETAASSSPSPIPKSFSEFYSKFEKKTNISRAIQQFKEQYEFCKDIQNRFVSIIDELQKVANKSELVIQTAAKSIVLIFNDLQRIYIQAGSPITTDMLYICALQMICQALKEDNEYITLEGLLTLFGNNPIFMPFSTIGKTLQENGVTNLSTVLPLSNLLYQRPTLQPQLLALASDLPTHELTRVIESLHAQHQVVTAGQLQRTLSGTERSPVRAATLSSEPPLRIGGPRAPEPPLRIGSRAPEPPLSFGRSRPEGVDDILKQFRTGDYRSIGSLIEILKNRGDSELVEEILAHIKTIDGFPPNILDDIIHGINERAPDILSIFSFFHISNRDLIIGLLHRNLHKLIDSKNIQDKDGNTILMKLCQKLKEDPTTIGPLSYIITALLSSRPDPTIINKQGQSPYGIIYTLYKSNKELLPIKQNMESLAASLGKDLASVTPLNNNNAELGGGRHPSKKSRRSKRNGTRHTKHKRVGRILSRKLTGRNLHRSHRRPRPSSTTAQRTTQRRSKSNK